MKNVSRRPGLVAAQVDRSVDPGTWLTLPKLPACLRYARPKRDSLLTSARPSLLSPNQTPTARTSKAAELAGEAFETVWAVPTASGRRGGHKSGTPGAPASSHPYAGDERLARLGELRDGSQPASAELAADGASSHGLRVASSIRQILCSKPDHWLKTNCPVLICLTQR